VRFQSKSFIFILKQKNNNLIVHTSSVLNLGSEKIIITISDISNEIILAVEEKEKLCFKIGVYCSYSYFDIFIIFK
jgi:hypothetical protein